MSKMSTAKANVCAFLVDPYYSFKRAFHALFCEILPFQNAVQQATVIEVSTYA